jgi:hypothetical protein
VNILFVKIVWQKYNNPLNLYLLLCVKLLKIELFMEKYRILTISKSILVVVILLISNGLSAQQKSFTQKSTANYWENIQFGGGIGLSIGSGYTDISLVPSAIYNFSEQVALGLGVQYTYVKQKDFFTSNLYGGSIIGLFNPIKEIQLSAELEQLRVNVNLQGNFINPKDHWNTGLFFGAGYRSGNTTIGARYNVLHDNSKSAYSNAFMPFVRVYF